MGKCMFRIIVSAGWLLIWAGSAGGVELLIPADGSVDLNRQIGKNYYRFPVENREAERVGMAFEGWAVESLDFDIAKRTTSSRFGGRETFYQELEKNIPVYIESVIREINEMNMCTEVSR